MTLSPSEILKIFFRLSIVRAVCETRTLLCINLLAWGREFLIKYRKYLLTLPLVSTVLKKFNSKCCQILNGAESVTLKTVHHYRVCNLCLAREYVLQYYCTCHFLATAWYIYS